MKKDEFGLPRRRMIVGNICMIDLLMFGVWVAFILWLWFGLPNILGK